ncbi:MAG: hypothetical protein P8Y70_05580 [Candidatus Lokiarchaeota archaeon]
MGEEENKKESENPFFEDIVKKTKTGLTIPKELRELLFENDDSDVYFHLTVPMEKDKIILRILSENEVEEIKSKTKESGNSKQKSEKRSTKNVKSDQETFGPKWGEYFVYDFEAKDKVKSILESAFDKFSQNPINFDDAMGRVKYALILYLSSTKTENAKLYFSVLKFLIDIIEYFKLPNLIDWLYEKIVPNIESQFLYELALLELIEIAVKANKLEKAKEFTQDILKNIDSYPKSELYNIMNSLNQLVRRVSSLNNPKLISDEIKKSLISYENDFENIDYKIQIIEMLEDLRYIEDAFHLAKDIQVTLPPESIKLREIRNLVKRLEEKPI